jgi:citrate lyase subunit beta/citryl-CoA lyase
MKGWITSYMGRYYAKKLLVRHLNEVFTLTSEEIAYYQGLLAAMEEAERQGTAAVTYQGAMVDIAMMKTAQQMLALAWAIGSHNVMEK